MKISRNQVMDSEIAREGCAPSRMRLGIALALVAATLPLAVCFAEKQPLSRYQSIIDRQMFGPLPEGFDPTKSPNEVQKTKEMSRSEQELAKEQEKLQSAIHFSMINVTPEGTTEVGFTDNSDPKLPKNYLLKVGETKDGWTLKEADAVAAKMTIAKGDIEVSLTLGGNSAKGAGTTARAGAGKPSVNAVPPPGAGRGGLLGGSLRARRQRRMQEAEEARKKAEAAAAEKEAAAAEREAERQQRAEQEKAQHDAEREEQRRQLLAIQEELKKVREAKGAKPSGAEGDSDNGEN